MDLLSTLNLGRRSLQTQRQGVEVAGNNLANVNTQGYSRQRVVISSSPTVDSGVGPMGTGAEVTAIEQLRNTLLDRQAETEYSVTGSLTAQQSSLQTLQAKVGQQIDRAADGASASAAGNGLAQELAGFFNSFQTLSAQPTSLEARQAAIQQARQLADRFNQVDRGLSDVRDQLNASIATDVDSANKLLAKVASLNEQISTAEGRTGGSANELRDSRQQTLEALAKIVKVDVAEDASGEVDVSVAGVTLVNGRQVADRLQTYNTGAGNLGVQTAAGAAPLSLQGGSLHGYAQVRDEDLANLQRDVDQLAATLVTAVNALHSAGYSPTGTTGADFFQGTSAATIQVNSALVTNPSLLQVSGEATAAGNNQVALALAQLATQPQTALNGATFSEGFTRTVTRLGDSLDSVNGDLATQKAVENLLQQQRDSVSGVSLDEEMTDLMKFQKAYQASARLISTVDEMLDTVIGLK